MAPKLVEKLNFTKLQFLPFFYHPVTFHMLHLDIIRQKTFLAQVEHHTLLGSTNDRGRECPIGPGETPRLIVADRQTAGRGRDQTSWWTGENSLAFSLVFDGQRFQNDPRRRLLIALVAGIAVSEAVDAWLHEDEKRFPDPFSVGLHWPNDVFVNGRKLCGILVEIPRDGRIIVGIGINTNDRVADAPAELAERITTLRDLTGHECDPTDLLVGILNRFQLWKTALMEDSTRVGRRADELCLQRGAVLNLDPGDGQIHSGRCLGIASDGALCLETLDGPRSFYSGRLV